MHSALSVSGRRAFALALFASVLFFSASSTARAARGELTLNDVRSGCPQVFDVPLPLESLALRPADAESFAGTNPESAVGMGDRSFRKAEATLDAWLDDLNQKRWRRIKPQDLRYPENLVGQWVIIKDSDKNQNFSGISKGQVLGVSIRGAGKDSFFAFEMESGKVFVDGKDLGSRVFIYQSELLSDAATAGAPPAFAHWLALSDADLNQHFARGQKLLPALAGNADAYVKKITELSLPALRGRYVVGVASHARTGRTEIFSGNVEEVGERVGAQTLGIRDAQGTLRTVALDLGAGASRYEIWLRSPGAPNIVEGIDPLDAEKLYEPRGGDSRVGARVAEFLADRRESLNSFIELHASDGRIPPAVFQALRAEVQREDLVWTAALRHAGELSPAKLADEINAKFGEIENNLAAPLVLSDALPLLRKVEEVVLLTAAYEHLATRNRWLRGYLGMEAARFVVRGYAALSLHCFTLMAATYAAAGAGWAIWMQTNPFRDLWPFKSASFDHYDFSRRSFLTATSFVSMLPIAYLVHHLTRAPSQLYDHASAMSEYNRALERWIELVVANPSSSPLGARESGSPQ